MISLSLIHIYQRVQNAGITELGLEVLQAFVVLHVGAGQDAFQPGGVHGERVVAGAGDREGPRGLGALVGALVLRRIHLDGRQVLQAAVMKFFMFRLARLYA